MITRFDCCGVKEFAQIRRFDSAESAMRHFCSMFSWTKQNGEFIWNPLHAGAFFFSSAGKFSRFRRTGPFRWTTVKCPAAQLTAYIEEHELGEVTIVPSFINPNTGRRIFVYLWYPYVRNLRRWWLAQQNQPAPSWGDELLAQLERQ